MSHHNVSKILKSSTNDLGSFMIDSKSEKDSHGEHGIKSTEKINIKIENTNMS